MDEFPNIMYPLHERELAINAPFSKMAAIEIFFCFYSNYALMPRSRQNILLNFKLKNEASRANLNKNKRIFKWRAILGKGVCQISRVFNSLEAIFQDLKAKSDK